MGLIRTRQTIQASSATRQDTVQLARGVGATTSRLQSLRLYGVLTDHGKPIKRRSILQLTFLEVANNCPSGHDALSREVYIQLWACRRFINDTYGGRLLIYSVKSVWLF